MNTSPAGPETVLKFAWFRNWISIGGLTLVASSIFAFLLLFGLEFFSGHGNPYVGILAYLVAPGFLLAGVFLTIGGVVWQRRQQRKKGAAVRPLLLFDLTHSRDRKNLVILVVSAMAFLLVTSIGSYHSYHFTESVEFCGQACHTVMKPEYTTYLHSPHARVACSECHIGPGATWYVKSKISGAYQVYATLFGKFPRPIETPIANLRPAQETCERCHWPEKFVGNLDRTYTHFLADETNTLYAVRLSMKVGGGDPRHGPVSGIHWHMNVGNKVEFITTDKKHQVIPWVRVTNPQGVVTEYATEDFDGNVKGHKVRKMDCMDCHNRPSHIFKSPNESVDLALALGRLDPSMPFIKREAVDVLTQPYETEEEARTSIATLLTEKYPDDRRLTSTIEEVQRIFSDNFFPEMRANWSVYPNNIGHKDWPGCFRCHDGNHKTVDGKKVLASNDCNSCHTILAEGGVDQMRAISPDGLEFKHPEEGWEGFLCNDCHTGSND